MINQQADNISLGMSNSSRLPEIPLLSETTSYSSGPVSKKRSDLLSNGPGRKKLRVVLMPRKQGARKAEEPKASFQQKSFEPEDGEVVLQLTPSTHFQLSYESSFSTPKAGNLGTEITGNLLSIPTLPDSNSITSTGNSCGVVIALKPRTLKRNRQLFLLPSESHSDSDESIA
eukprot:CAMPEP_0183714464 /NCGR_PEP_ID=MMETSP0737-20130205/8965_1 /TAXON_ID=385413 /ORGANISM="Thalassiosira miniscula, Strain CCMP1093" /LENGTH=172 /DNA_ID=CAMNT_0025943395 /DNA_START=44 /DNA_END=562 /DNA_ORIENTATION=-